MLHRASIIAHAPSRKRNTPMTRLQHAANAVHTITLSVWAGAIAATGLLAAIAFPTMKDLNPTLQGIAADNAEHWRIAAGTIFNKAFHQVQVPTLRFDTAATWLLTVAAVSFAITQLPSKHDQPKRTPRTAAKAVHILGVITLLALVANTGSVAAEMTALSDQLTAAARAGDEATVEAIRADFDRMHDAITPRIAAQIVMLLALAAAPFLSLRTHHAAPQPAKQTA